MFHAPGVQVVALVPVAGPVPPPIKVVSPFAKASWIDLRTDEMDVRIDSTGRDDLAFRRRVLRWRRRSPSRLRDAVHQCQDFPALPIADDAPVTDTNIGFVDAPTNR